MGIENEIKKIAKKLDYSFSEEEERVEICFEHFIQNNINICSIKDKKQICQSPQIIIDNLSLKTLFGGNTKFTEQCLKEFRNHGYTNCESLEEHYEKCELSSKVLYKTSECLGELTKADKQICINGYPLKSTDIGEIRVNSDIEDASFLLDCYTAIQQVKPEISFCHDEL